MYFWDDTLLSISRLTDRAGKGAQQRLSVQQLPALIEDPEVREEVKEKMDMAVEKAKFARDWRNRRIAHRDMSHALDPQARPLAAASRQRVEEALEALGEVLNTINRRLRDSTSLFDLADPVGGTESLLYVLRDGLAAKRERDQAMREGSLPPEKWGPPPAI